ncbi:MAG: hypothetical protein IMF01_09570 [Proteobacteria bacterium]|nr:hypothetical protein [Pseudomonadota bacterium]
MDKSEYIYAVEAFTDFEDCPEFTNCTKTLFYAKLSEKRFKEQGLSVVIRPMAEMAGLNPFYEKH